MQHTNNLLCNYEVEIVFNEKVFHAYEICVVPVWLIFEMMKINCASSRGAFGLHQNIGKSVNCKGKPQSFHL